ncbi:MAG: metallophosphoesterase family protein, partial [Candidatus Omnitrophica bacterium]|nr:metallophosphoesterase family protein [Candidatus Omnitrophota bacterium]
MRYAIFSDIHSNLEAFKAVIKAYKKESIDEFVCAGDVVGYGADPRECIAELKRLAMITVAGNHDWAGVNLFPADYFNEDARRAIIWTKGELGESENIFLSSLKLVYQNADLTLVHGTLHEPQEFNYMIDYRDASDTFKLLETGACFLG